LGELFNAAYFPGHPLGRPIEGTEKPSPRLTTKRSRVFTRASLHLRTWWCCGRNIEHERLVDLVESSFQNSQPMLQPTVSTRLSNRPRRRRRFLLSRKQELEQAALVIAAPWPDAKSSDRYAASLLASVVGGGTSSRLWQTIREERGLAYSVGAGGNTFSDVGVFTIYAGTSPQHLNEVLDISLAEMRRAVAESVSAKS